MVMLDVRNAIAEILDHTTLASVVERVDAARNLSQKGETGHE
jgi:DNA-binding IscR family transcriptional regulator